ncbi:carbonic anhydrase 12 isoform X2 [Octopus bimaculoides]|uniref:carbonic anhydrase 12 isoform X2 n=1 Tax=Octopus bimaculoides TaxID=37653 RepID=UPI00071DB566|nr:carbonic anhydrase 12 isoform X2 [Octopus bimaculoides]|eukprot:XP_014780517.1 PREDICTED: carbonic anhydrase 12-like isoform X2 [Octopus bimaculoides]
MEKTFWMVYLMATFSAMLFVHLVSAWDYHNESKNWAKEYPNCGGRLQSPIAIEHKFTNYKKTSNLIFDGYLDTKHNATIMNTGHTVVIEVNGKSLVYGEGLKGKYIAYEIHFHWGMNDIVGSEHMLNGHRFPMEIHILHYSEKYPNSEKASKYKGGLLVVAYFVKNDKSYADNEDLADVVKNVKMVKFKGNRYPVISWKLEAFFPVNQTCYYRYEGSLTYPPCWETVIWVIFKDALQISSDE